MIKIYGPFDTKSMQKRVEKTVNDKYSVHLEDFENINDLIRRSIITKTSFKAEKIDGLTYDTDKELTEFFNGKPEELSADETSDMTEQSEVKADVQSAEGETAKP